MKIIGSILLLIGFAVLASLANTASAYYTGLDDTAVVYKSVNVNQQCHGSFFEFCSNTYVLTLGHDPNNPIRREVTSADILEIGSTVPVKVDSLNSPDQAILTQGSNWSVHVVQTSLAGLALILIGVGLIFGWHGRFAAMVSKKSTSTRKSDPESGAALFTAMVLGPLAFALLARRSYPAVKNPEKGNQISVFVLGFYAVLIGGFALLATLTNYRMPLLLILIIYYSVIYLIVSYSFMSDFDHVNFKAIWRASLSPLIVILSFLFYITTLLGYVWLEAKSLDPDISITEAISLNLDSENNIEEASYKKGLQIVYENQEEALSVLKNSKDLTSEEFLKGIERGITLWEESQAELSILQQKYQLSEEARMEYDLGQQYLNLRIQQYSLIKEAAQQNSYEYDSQIDEVEEKIIRIVKQLNTLEG